MSPTHEAGWAHADGALRGPGWLRPPDDANALVPTLWSSTAQKVGGDLVVGGVAIPELVANVSTPAYVLDEADLRARARAFRDAFAGYDVYYAARPSSAPPWPAGSPRRGCPSTSAPTVS